MIATGKKYVFLIWMFLLCSLPFSSQADEYLPKWELGLGAAYISYPDYPGSDKQENLWLPLPYFVYRSDSLMIDNSQITKSLFDNERLELDFNVTGGMPVSSEDNDKREGMDDLDAYAGIGPSLNYRLMQQGDNTLKLELPFRAIVAASSEEIHYEGLQFEPGVSYFFKNQIDQHQKLEITIGLSLQYADAKFHNYLYGVSSEDVSPERSFFKADSGFAGINHKLGLDWYFNDFKLGAFWRGTDMSRAVFKDSPLMDSTFTHSFGFFVSWRFLKSKEKVLSLN